MKYGFKIEKPGQTTFNVSDSNGRDHLFVINPKAGDGLYLFPDSVEEFNELSAAFAKRKPQRHRSTKVIAVLIEEAKAQPKPATKPKEKTQHPEVNTITLPETEENKAVTKEADPIKDSENRPILPDFDSMNSSELGQFIKSDSRYTDYLKGKYGDLRCPLPEKRERLKEMMETLNSNAA